MEMSFHGPKAGAQPHMGTSYNQLVAKFEVMVAGDRGGLNYWLQSGEFSQLVKDHGRCLRPSIDRKDAQVKHLVRNGGPQLKRNLLAVKALIDERSRCEGPRTEIAPSTTGCP